MDIDVIKTRSEVENLKNNLSIVAPVTSSTTCFISLNTAEKNFDSLKTDLLLNAMAANASSRVIHRGEVYLCDFGYGVGSEIQKNRPAIIVQQNVANLHSPNTIVVPITHDQSNLPCMIPFTPLTDAYGNKILDGKANVSCIECVSKARLGNYIGKISNSDIKAIDTQIGSSVGLLHYYSGVSNNLKDVSKKLKETKEERNKAQDCIKEISKIISNCGLNDPNKKLEEIKKIIDNFN